MAYSLIRFCKYGTRAGYSYPMQLAFTTEEYHCNYGIANNTLAKILCCGLIRGAKPSNIIKFVYGSKDPFSYETFKTYNIKEFI